MTLGLLLAVLMVLVYPTTAFADTDYVSFGQSYAYVSTGDEVSAGTVKAEYKTNSSVVDGVYVEIKFPSGVEFVVEPQDDSSEPGYWDELVDGAAFLDSSDSDSIKVYKAGWSSGNEIKFDFGTSPGSNYEGWLDIDDDFSGNLDVTVEVVGVKDNSIIWVESDELTIAKAAKDDVIVTAGDVRTVSIGNGTDAGSITIEESRAELFSSDEMIFLEIESDGITFAQNNSGDPDLDVDYVQFSGAACTWGQDSDNNNVYDRVCLNLTAQSGPFPGEIKIDPINLDIDPDEKGDIKISVWSEKSDGTDGELDETTVTIATVKDNEITVTADEDTGMEEHMRITAIGELWELTLESSGKFEEGDKIYITLPENYEFYKTAASYFGGHDLMSDEVTYMGLYNSESSMWLEVNANGDGEDEITLSKLYVAALPGAQYGDINVEISGEVGTATAKAGFLKPAVMIEPEQTYVVAPGYGQPAGNITFTETDKDAVFDGMNLHMVLPNGVEFASTPTVTVNGEEIDDVRIGPGEYDKDVCRFTVDKSSKSKVDTLVVSDIKYDIENWFTAGNMINVSLGGNDPQLDDTFNKFYESYLAFADQRLEGSPADPENWKNFQFYNEADEEIIAIPNAIVVDADQVKVSFTVGDEGVYMENGRTLVQINLLSEALGLQKSWDPDTKTAYFVKDGKTVAFPIGQNKVTVGQADMPVDQGAKIIGDSTCVTLRGLEMAFGGELTWDDETKTAIFIFNK